MEVVIDPSNSTAVFQWVHCLRNDWWPLGASFRSGLGASLFPCTVWPDHVRFQGWTIRTNQSLSCSESAVQSVSVQFILHSNFMMIPPISTFVLLKNSCGYQWPGILWVFPLHLVCSHIVLMLHFQEFSCWHSQYSRFPSASKEFLTIRVNSRKCAMRSVALYHGVVRI